MWTVKLGADGGLEWQKSIGGAGDDPAYSLTKSPDGGFVLAGRSDSSDGDFSQNRGNDDIWIVSVGPEVK